jgi:membrane-associated phospholipid phosphatase
MRYYKLVLFVLAALIIASNSTVNADDRDVINEEKIEEENTTAGISDDEKTNSDQDRVKIKKDSDIFAEYGEKDFSYHLYLLGEDFQDMFSTTSLMVYTGALLPTWPVYNDEKPAGTWEPTKGSPAFDFIDFFHGGGTPVAISLYLMARGHIWGDRRSGDVGYTIFRSQLTATAFVRPMKIIVGRQRPDGGDRLSFPSGHAITTFAFANIIDKEYGHLLGALSYTYAFLSCWARVDEKEHYWSDIIYGGIVGWWLGEISYRNTHNLLDTEIASTIQFVPVNEGVGLVCTLTF